MKSSNIVAGSVLASLVSLSLVHCGPDESRPVGATAGNGGKGGAAQQVGNGGASAGAVQTSNGGAAAGTTATGQGGAAGSSGSQAGAAGANSSNALCSGSMPSGTLHGSCDARATTGDSQGRCREWYGLPNAGLTFACPNGDGQYSAGVACPTERRVGRCILPFAAIDVDTVLIYYAPTFDAASARSACVQIGGTCIRDAAP